MFKRQHYNFLAEHIKDYIENSTSEEAVTIQEFTESLIVQFEQNNEYFDGHKFAKKCGF